MFDHWCQRIVNKRSYGNVVYDCRDDDEANDWMPYIIGQVAVEQFREYWNVIEFPVEGITKVYSWLQSAVGPTAVRSGTLDI